MLGRAFVRSKWPVVSRDYAVSVRGVLLYGQRQMMENRVLYVTSATELGKVSIVNQYGGQ